MAGRRLGATPHRPLLPVPAGRGAHPAHELRTRERTHELARGAASVVLDVGRRRRARKRRGEGAGIARTLADRQVVRRIMLPALALCSGHRRPTTKSCTPQPATQHDTVDTQGLSCHTPHPFGVGASGACPCRGRLERHGFGAVLERHFSLEIIASHTVICLRADSNILRTPRHGQKTFQKTPAL